MNPKTTEIKLTRVIDATPEEVYEVWLDQKSPGSPWYGVPKVIMETPKVDGLFYTAYENEGREYAHYGRFLALDKPSKIQYTWVSEGTHGSESILTISFKEVDGKSQVDLLHENVPDDEYGKNHLNAWGFVLGRMTKYFADKK